jgi:hypothetical protein
MLFSEYYTMGEAQKSNNPAHVSFGVNKRKCGKE